MRCINTLLVGLRLLIRAADESGLADLDRAQASQVNGLPACLREGSTVPRTSKTSRIQRLEMQGGFWV
jgi:hypothetical protein